MDVAAASGDSQPGWAWTDHSMMKSSLFVFLATTTLLNIPQYSEYNRMSSESRYRSNNCHEPLLSSSVFRWGSTAHSRQSTDFFNLLYTEEAPKFPPRMESSWNLTWCRHCYGLTGKIMTRMQFNGPVRGMREVQSLSGGIWVVQNSTRLLCTSYDWFSIQSEKYLLQKPI